MDRIVTVDNVIAYLDRHNIQPSLATNDIFTDISTLTYSPRAAIILVNYNKLVVDSRLDVYFDPMHLKTDLEQGYAGHLFGSHIYFKRGFVLDKDFKLYALPFEFTRDLQDHNKPIFS